MRVRDPRLLVVVSAVMLGAAIAFPLGVIASHQFTDVPNTNSFHADIDAIADAGITTGCGGGKYCPKDFVTREQMAAFMNRLGALQAGKIPVVNATKLDGMDSTDFLGAGNIEIVQQGPWQPLLGGLEMMPGTTATDIHKASAGGASAKLPLQAPGTIDGQAYGLLSVAICYGGSTNVTIIATGVIDGEIDNDQFPLINSTQRDLSSAACYTISTANPRAPIGGTALFFDLNYTGSGTARIGSVTSVWTPVD